MSRQDSQDSNDIATTTPMVRQYLDIKNQHKDCLLFYRLGDFFELFFDDAVTASKELGLALTKRGKHGDSDIPMCGVPYHAYELYLSKLVQKGYKVALCDQTESPQEAKNRGAKGPLKREVIRIVTSGTLLEDELLSSGYNYIMALSLVEASMLSAAVTDVSTGKLRVETFSLDKLNTILEKWQPVEIVLSDELFALCTSVLSPWEKKLTFLPKARFNTDNTRNLLEETYNIKTLDVFWKMDKTQIQALGTLIDYIRITQCQKNLSFLPPQLVHSHEFMEIDASTRRNLELFATTSTQGATLFSVVNKTVTNCGRRLLQDWLSAPLLNPDLINKRLDCTDFFLNHLSLTNKIREILNKSPDIERALSRLSFKRATPKDLKFIKLILDKAEILVCLFQNEPFLQKWTVHLQRGATLQNLLKQALKEDMSSVGSVHDFLNDAFDKDLAHYRQLRDHASEELTKLQERYIQQTGICNLHIRRNNIWGIYIEVSSGQISKVPFDFVHRQTLTNCTRYTNADLMELEKNIQEAEQLSIAREMELFNALCQDVLQQKDMLESLSKALEELDAYTSLAVLAKQNNYVRPEIVQDSILEIIDGRHPVVELSQKDTFTSNDCVMDLQHRFLLLTGPNMAGKSTYLRQNALLIIMAQAGFFVPAKQAKIGIVDQIFSRIGASDDLASGRSTFMVEMIETAAILHQATSKSFVILDEVGRGTSTYDGLSIAWAVCEHLVQITKCRTLFATHYHELTQLKNVLPNIVFITAAIQEWEGKVIFLHKIIEGMTKRSYGIHVAQLAGLPKSVIARATDLLKMLEQNHKKSKFHNETATHRSLELF